MVKTTRLQLLHNSLTNGQGVFGRRVGGSLSVDSLSSSRFRGEGEVTHGVGLLPADALFPQEWWCEPISQARKPKLREFLQLSVATQHAWSELWPTPTKT